MLQYIPFKNYKHANRLNNLWNHEFNAQFPISSSLYKSRILEDVNLNKEASFIALYDNEPVGFILIKSWQVESGLCNEEEIAYISLIFVNKEMRNMGIGSDMLSLAITELKKNPKITYLRVGDDINRLICGVPSEMTNASIFFVNKGFVQKSGKADMIRVVRNEALEEVPHNNLEYRIATEDEKDEILKLCIKNHWNRYAYALNGYFENGGTGRRIVLACKDNKIVGLARIYEENKTPLKLNLFMKDNHIGEVYFIGVDEEYQDCGYDRSINISCKNYLIKRGCKKIVVPAIEDVKYYKEFGYSAFKYYLCFEKKL